MQKIALCLVVLLAIASPVLAQDEIASSVQSPNFLALVVSSLVWSTFAVVISQGISIFVMWLLGLPPRKLIHEIEDVQNPAVGALFFIISFTATIFVGFMTTDGFTPDPSALEGAAWIIGGLIIALGYTYVLLELAHRIMGRQPNESLYGYIQREIVKEQNAALAFFLGGMATTPFISVVFQLL